MEAKEIKHGDVHCLTSCGFNCKADTAKLEAVPRHSVDGYGRQDICYNDPEGEFVFYSDYEALKDALEAAQKRIVELEARKFRLPESVIDAICHTAAEIHNLGRGVSDDRAQEIINSIRCAAGINLETGG